MITEPGLARRDGQSRAGGAQGAWSRPACGAGSRREFELRPWFRPPIRGPRNRPVRVGGKGSLVVWCALIATTLGAAGAAHGQEGRRLDRNTITVTGSGDSRSAPDVAYVTAGVVTDGKRARDAAAANAETSQKVMAALKQQGIAERDLQTSNYGVQPLFENVQQSGREPKIVGYRVSNQIRATVRKLSAVGNVIDAALDAGANNIHGVNFGLEDRAKAESEALAEAVAAARRKADTMARASGVRITGVAQIQEGFSQRPVPAFEANLGAMRAGAATPIAPGEMTITALVTIVYDITGPRAEPDRKETTREARAAWRR